MPTPLTLAIVATVCVGPTAAAANVMVTAAAAIERAALDRVGARVVRVDVELMSTTVPAAVDLVAVPDPIGRIGYATRFTLTVDGARRGVAIATVHVGARVVRATKPIVRNERIELDAVTVAERDLAGQPFARVLDLDQVVGTRSRRTIEPGVLILPSMVTAPLAVEHGQRIQVGVSVGLVHAMSEGTASGSGYVGDVVHVRQTGRRGLLRARIVDRGVVEVEP